MIHFPDAIIINDDILLDAIKELSPIGFKIFMYVYYCRFYYEEWGDACDSKDLETLQDILQLEYDQIIEGYIENRRKGYIDGFLVLESIDGGNDLIFRCQIDVKPRPLYQGDSTFNIETHGDWGARYWNTEAIVIGTEIIRKP